MADLDQQFVEYVVKALVEKPDAVQVVRSVDDMGVLLELTVDPDDMGKVIGKAGATAKSIRTLLRVLGAKNDERVNLKIVEPEGSERPARTAPVESAPVAEANEPEAEEVVEEAPVAEDDDYESDLQARTRADLADLDDDF